MDKKDFVIYATELCAVKMYVQSDKNPDEFDSIEEFYNYADFIDSKTNYGEFQGFHEVEEV